jgi:hypothetical protein
VSLTVVLLIEVLLIEGYICTVLCYILLKDIVFIPLLFADSLIREVADPTKCRL